MKAFHHQRRGDSRSSSSFTTTLFIYFSYLRALFQPWAFIPTGSSHTSLFSINSSNASRSALKLLLKIWNPEKILLYEGCGFTPEAPGAVVHTMNPISSASVAVISNEISFFPTILIFSARWREEMLRSLIWNNQSASQMWWNFTKWCQAAGNQIQKPVIAADYPGKFRTLISGKHWAITGYCGGK